MKIFFFSCLFLIGFSFANPEWLFQSEVCKKDSSDIVFRKDRMSSLFANKPIDWNRDGIYLFIEQKNDLRLFVIGNDVYVDVFQYPKQKISKWLNPVEYLKEREELSGKGLGDVCHQQILVDSVFLNEIRSIPFEEYPMIVAAKRKSVEHGFYYPVANKEGPFYLGYVKQGTDMKYFRFRDFRQENMLLEPPLNTFEHLFKLLNQSFFSTVLNKCK